LDHTWFLINQHTLEWTTKRRCNLVPLPHPCADLPRRPEGPVYLAKYDIKDGFYRMMIRAMHWPHRHPPQMMKNKWWRSPRPHHGLDQLAPHFLCHVGDGVTRMRACTGAHSPPHRLNIGVNPRHPSTVIFRRSSTDLPSAAERPTCTGAARTGLFH
jgi:hypothetical protein